MKSAQKKLEFSPWLSLLKANEGAPPLSYGWMDGSYTGCRLRILDRRRLDEALHSRIEDECHFAYGYRLINISWPKLGEPCLALSRLGSESNAFYYDRFNGMAAPKQLVSRRRGWSVNYWPVQSGFLAGCRSCTTYIYG